MAKRFTVTQDMLSVEQVTDYTEDGPGEFKVVLWDKDSGNKVWYSESMTQQQANSHRLAFKMTIEDWVNNS